MAYNPGVSFFIKFHDLDPSSQSRCIFFTQKRERCLWSCQDSDNRRAIELHKTITAYSGEDVPVDLLQEYALCNCCRSGRARHRDRIEDIGLLMPLAERWQDEIWRHAATLTSGHSEPRYDLRRREASNSSSQPALSEFRPHLADPLPSDSVYQKILKPIGGREDEPGSLYIFDRDSSPGHVKIGWTAISVASRLEDWSKCGYTPNLLFSVDNIPHALRVETLTHHELTKEWRRERKCKAKHCGKSHQEWFEVSKERAIQVLSDWASFIKNAKPFEDGGLTSRWRNVVKMMDTSKEVISAENLLKHYKAFLVEREDLSRETANLVHVPKIEEEVGTGYGPEVGHLVASEKTLAGADLPRIGPPTLSQITPLPESEVLSRKVSLPKVETTSTSDAISTSDILPKTETLPTMRFLSTAEPLSKTEALLKAEPLPWSQQEYEETLAERTPVKKLLPEQVPLFWLPLESTNITQDTVSSQETQPSPSTGTEKAGATHIATKSDTGITIVDNSSNLKVESSGSRVTVASPSATRSEDIHRTNTDTRNNVTTTNPPLLNFSDPSSEPDLSDSPTTSASPRVKVELVPDPPVQLVSEISNELLSLKSDREEEEVIGTLTSTPQFKQNAEEDGQPKLEIELLGPYQQICKEEVKSHDQVESIATENKPGTEVDEWDADETLVGDHTPRSLEKMVLKIVDGLYDDISTDKASGLLNDLDGLKVLGSEPPLAVKVVS